MYHYAGNNPVRYTDPDGREQALSSLNTLSSTRIQKFLRAQENTLYNMDNIINILDNYTVSCNQQKFQEIKESAEKWLKISLSTSDSINQFNMDLKKMKSILESLTPESVKYDAHDHEHYAKIREVESGSLIYGSHSNKTLVLCEDFFMNETDREKVLFHEMIHYALDTKDESYNKETFKKLDRKNASNWEIFYKEVSQ